MLRPLSGNILRLDMERLKTPVLRFLETSILRERC
jgi:hypothetical protein